MIETMVICVACVDRVVRLGEYNIGTDQDCGYSVHCPVMTKEYEVEDLIQHEEYKSKPYFINDIALVRLKEEIRFNGMVVK